MASAATCGGVVRAVETNVLVRLITRDDAKQLASAEAFVERGAWVSHLVLAEATWVLTSVYDCGPNDIATVVEMLLSHQHLTLQDPDTVTEAVAQFRARPALGFSDCLVVAIARKAGHLPLGTFDRSLAGVQGAQKV
jgi:predicted nucleic-acid-binding protein